MATFSPSHETPFHETPAHETPGHETPGHVTPGHETPADRPGVRPHEVTVGILTALPVELRAMAGLVDDVSRYRAPDDPNIYRLGRIPGSEKDRAHGVALLNTVGDGTQLAATCCAHMLRTFPNIRTVVMTGIGGGIPRPDNPVKHVRLGDIVVAVGGIVNYGSVRRQDGTTRLRGPQGAGLISRRLTQAVGELRFEAEGGDRRWERWLGPEGCERAGFPRPGPETDVLKLRNGGVVVHPALPVPGPPPGMPRVHYGTIGSADQLMADEGVRDALARDFPDLFAVEMEGCGIAASTSLIGKDWFMVRGVADYCENAGKNDVWHGYASHAAAAYVRALLEATPPVEIGERPQTVRSRPLLDDADQRTLDAILRRVPADLDIEAAWQQTLWFDVPLAEGQAAEVPNTPAQAYHFLAGRNAPASGLNPAFVFLARLVRPIRERDPRPAGDLDEWLAAYTRRTGTGRDLRTRLRPGSGAGPHGSGTGPSLVIELAVDGIDRDRFRVASYIQENAGPWRPRLLSERTVTEQLIEEAVGDSVSGAESVWAALLTSGDAGIEFVLPLALMNEPVQWFRALRMGVAKPIGVRYPVAVRSLERMRAHGVRREWASRWDRLDRHPFAGQVHWGTRDQIRQTSVDAWSTGLSGDGSYVVVVLSEPPGTELGSRELFAALEAGVPVILWDQRPAHRDGDTTEGLRRLTAEPGELPAQTRALRVEAAQQTGDRPDHYGRTLALLWDDPNRVVGVAGVAGTGGGRP